MSEEIPTVASDVDAIIDIAQQAGTPHEIDLDGVYLVAIPEGADVRVVQAGDHDSVLRATPRRATGSCRVGTVEALAQLLERHASAATTVWVSSTQVIAVFNDHDANTPGWGDHRATLPLTPSREWRHWTGKDSQLVSQEQFAEHIEDGLNEIIEPDGATMLEIAQSFHATTSATFRSAARLQSGQVNFLYDEDVQASAGQAGTLSIPREFTIAVPPFDGEVAAPMTARLRYRLKAGHLTLGYKLDRPDAVLRDAVKAIADGLRAKHPAVFEGVPA